jgi:hypothetical protein
MFIGRYDVDGRDYFNLYYKNKNGWDEWHKDTFSPNCENIEMLDFKISGKTYKERQASLRDLAIEWQTRFAWYGWSYGELSEMQSYFYENAKRYGLLKEFKENAIC